MGSKGTTEPGYVNSRKQRVIRPTGMPGTDHMQYIYVLECGVCSHRYGANGSDIHIRKCPECQGGQPGLDFGESPPLAPHRVAGVDSCPAGWFRIVRDVTGGALDFQVVSTASDLLDVESRPDVVAIDIPVGLPASGSRICDLEARRHLGSPRGSSVFPAPIRPALSAASHEEASSITEAVDGRRVAAQAWGIFPKVCEVDRLLQEDPEARSRFREVHPEVSFWAWNDGRPIAPGKKTEPGRAARLQLAEAWLGPELLTRARASRRKKDLGDDDILDAVAALWTATRIANGTAQTLPIDPPKDGAGLPMEIVY